MTVSSNGIDVLLAHALQVTLLTVGKACTKTLSAFVSDLVLRSRDGRILNTFMHKNALGGAQFC